MTKVELGAVVDALRRVTVQVRTGGSGLGGGVVWNPGSLVITNAHVARGDRARIEFADGRVASARVVARDRRRDLAALELDGSLPAGEAAVLREPPAPRVGDLVIAVGHPEGHPGATTLGIIHAVDGDEADRPPRWIRADLRLAPGFSGGPLADAAGRVIGINTLVQGGLAFAVPAAAVERWLRRTRLPAEAELGVGVAR
ncbi:MAG TPA: serine protease [Gemmatimonadales bacterium]|nr:serine protease [Gemmatimonadales bacterium]